MAKKSAAQKSLPVVDEAEAIVEPAPAFVDAGVIIPASDPAPTPATIGLELIDESPTNPRKDMGDLAELAESIRSAGVLQPVTVRPKGDDRFELVFGHRRFRAAALAGLKTIPAQVRDLTDQQVAELQLVENAQRKDASPLEEADAYRRLHEEFGLSADAIAQRVGKSKASVYARMKLGDLKDEKARAALLSGKIDASVALLIARLTPAEQAKASRRIVDGREYDRDQASDEPMSYRQALDYLREELYLHPADAPFDVSDASLVPSAGACTKCPKRVDVAGLTIVGQKVGEDDLCDDAACWSKKVNADRDEKLGAQVEKTKIRPLSTTENAKLFNQWGEFEPHNRDTGYVLPENHPDYDETGSYQNRRTWDDLANEACKKNGSGVDGFRELLVLALDKSKVVRLFDRKKVLKVIRDAGLIKKPSDNSGERDYTSPRTKQLTPYRKLVDKANEALAAALVDAFRDKMRASPELDAKLLRLAVADDLGWKTKGTIKRHALPQPTYGMGGRDYFSILAKVKADDLRAIGCEAILEKRLERTSHDERFVNLRGTKGLPKPYVQLAEIFGVDVGALEKKASQDLEAALAKLKKPKGDAAEAPAPAKTSEPASGSGQKAKSIAPPKPAKDPFKAIASAGRKAVKKIVAKSKPKTAKKPKAKK